MSSSLPLEVGLLLGRPEQLPWEPRGPFPSHAGVWATRLRTGCSGRWQGGLQGAAARASRGVARGPEGQRLGHPGAAAWPLWPDLRSHRSLLPHSTAEEITNQPKLKEKERHLPSPLLSGKEVSTNLGQCCRAVTVGHQKSVTNDDNRRKFPRAEERHEFRIESGPIVPWRRKKTSNLDTS